MFSFILLILITALVLGIAISLISIGGTIFLIAGADIIVAAFVIWLIYKAFKKK